MKKEKRRIAHEAAKFIENGDTIFLNGGTTVQYLIPFLSDKKDLTVITNNMRLAIELGDFDIDVICLGGHIQERPHVLRSDETVEDAMRYRADKVFFSVSGVTTDGFIQGFNSFLEKVMLKNSERAYFLTDKTKIVDKISEVVCDFSELSAVISDFEFPEETKKLYCDVEFINAKS